MQCRVGAYRRASGTGGGRPETIVKPKAVIETATYVDDLQATEAFYGTIAAMRTL